MANLLFGFFREVRCSETPRSPSRTGIAADTRALPKFVFIRVNFYLEYAKRILWRSLVDAFVVGHDTC